MTTRGSSRSDPRGELGSLGERIALAHLRRLGFRPLARNVRSRFGEIDLIVCDKRTLLFVEVKSRRARRGEMSARSELGPLGSLRAAQRARIRRLAAAWLRDPHRPRVRARDIRFDAIGVSVDAAGTPVRLEHIESAF